MKRAKVRILVGHSGLHGSFQPKDEPIIDYDIAKSLEKVKYLKILSVEEEDEQAVIAADDKEKAVDSEKGKKETENEKKSKEVRGG